jgi:hypothetical protein
VKVVQKELQVEKQVANKRVQEEGDQKVEIRETLEDLMLEDLEIFNFPQRLFTISITYLIK